MDEHDDETLDLPPLQVRERLVPMSQLHAAVAAERERCRRIVERAAETQGDLAANYARTGDSREYRHAHAFDVLEALRVAIDGTPVFPMPAPAQAEHDPEVGATFAGLPDRAVHGPADFGAKALGPSAWTGAVCCACDGHAGCVHTCPAQAEQRVSEEGYDPENPAHRLGATAYDAVIDALAKHPSEGMPHKWDKVAAQTVEHVVRKEAAIVLAASQHRIAARLRARADEEQRHRDEANRRGATYQANSHDRAMRLLRSEADALEEGKP